MKQLCCFPEFAIYVLKRRTEPVPAAAYSREEIHLKTSVLRAGFGIPHIKTRLSLDVFICGIPNPALSTVTSEMSESVISSLLYAAAGTGSVRRFKTYILFYKCKRINRLCILCYLEIKMCAFLCVIAADRSNFSNILIH